MDNSPAGRRTDNRPSRQRDGQLLPIKNKAVPKKNSPIYLCRLVAFAGLGTFPAGFGALLAMVVVVLFAFTGTLVTYFDALLDQVLGMTGIGGDKTGGQLADFGAVPICLDAVYHVLHIALGKAAVHTVFAGCSTGSQFLDKILVIHG
jgi:hypothetical protein